MDVRNIKIFKIPSISPETGPTAASPDTPVIVSQRPAAVISTLMPREQEGLLPGLLRSCDLRLDQHGKAHLIMHDAGNRNALHVGSRNLNNLIREELQRTGRPAKKADITELNEQLQSRAEAAGLRTDVWYRVAPTPGGIEIDLGDHQHTRIKIAAGKVDAINSGSEAVFFRTPFGQSLVMPAAEGNVRLLQKYVNLDAISKVLFIGWLTYTLAHPKVASTKYVILVLQGNQGSGKTSLCNNVILRLLDPTSVGVQVLPANERELAIASQNAHVLCFDNLRDFRQSMADKLCIASTGGAITSRQLYSDADQHVLHLHVALVLNGIHSFIDQPDLAQRCLQLQLVPIAETSRKSERQLIDELEADLPVIQRGLFDLIAKILLRLPTADVSHPERMYDFVQWLAAMELVDDAPPGAYQQEYSAALRQGQLESLQENLLAAAILDFAEGLPESGWTGTPAELHAELSELAPMGMSRSRDWPANAIALSKRLRGLQASLLTQGVRVELTRGKVRTITIGGARHD